MHITRPALALTAATAALLLLAGCTSASSSPDASTPAETPLTSYLNAIYGVSGSPTERKATEDAELAETDARIASCMAEQGFTYTPATRSYRETAGGDVEWKPNDREWVAQWGYGAVDYPGDVESSADTSDPNASFLETLSSSERAAWEAALWGSDAGDASTGDERAGSAGGCWSRANEKSGTDPLSTDQFAPLLQALSTFEDQQQRWPGQAQLDAEWSACMAEAGRPGIPSPRQAQDEIFTQVSDVAQNSKGTGASTERTRTTTRTPGMDAMKKTEVEMALADLDCRQTTDYDARAEKVRWSAEEQFVADHRAELDAAKAAAEQTRGRS